MSWLNTKCAKGDWTQAKQHENFMVGYDWFTPKSEPVKTLFNQPVGKVTPSSFFTKIGKNPFGLR
jgi:hypothetical protein